MTKHEPLEDIFITGGGNEAFSLVEVRVQSRIVNGKRVAEVVVDGHAVRCSLSVNRWTGAPHGDLVAHYVENGFRAREEQFANGTPVRRTYWKFDGRVLSQKSYTDTGFVEKTSPPWWWDVTDQTEPTAPWWKGDEQ